MAGPGSIGDSVPAGEDWLVRRLQDLERKVAELSAASTLEAASIGQGGLQILDGGSVQVIDSDTHVVAVIGALPSSYNRADGSPQPGLVFYREDGSIAVLLGDGNATIPPYKQAWQFYDRTGSIIVADDTNGGVGLARPYIPGGSFVDITGPTATTTSASFVGMQWADCYQQHPRLTASVLVQASSATTGEVRMTVGGAQIGSTLSVTAGLFSQLTIPAAAWPAGAYAFEQRVTVQLEARRLTGTGTIGVRGLGLWGVQS